MASLVLTGQSTQKQNLETPLGILQGLMNQRIAVWKKLPIEQKRKWISSGMDPVMVLAWQTFKHLRDNFFTEDLDTEGELIPATVSEAESKSLWQRIKGWFNG